MRGRERHPRAVGKLNLRRAVCALVKSVSSEGFDEGENIGCEFLGDAERGHGAVHKLFAIERDFIFLLLPHYFAQFVGFRHRKAGDVARDRHRLFLVASDRVRRS